MSERKLRLPSWLAAAAVAVAPLGVRVAVPAAVGAGAGLTAASLTAPSAPGPRTPPIRQAWLTRAGDYAVERVSVPCPGARVDLSKPPAGVGHTVEGSFESGLAVFRQHYAPHFLVGRDRAGRVRILQFCPLGELSAALENRAGGVETNRWARAQIELAGRSSSAPWRADAGVMRAFASLLLQLRDSAGIPLRRPYADGLVSYGPNARRASGAWGRTAGWFAHAELPENAHWDMGWFCWSCAIAQANALAPVINGGHPEEPPRMPPRPVYAIAAWKHGRPAIRIRSHAPATSVGRLVARGYTIANVRRLEVAR